MRNDGYSIKVKSFNEIACDVYIQQLKDQMKDEIASKGNEYILGVDEDDFKHYLLNKFSLEPLAINLDSEFIEEPKTSMELVEDRFYREPSQMEVYNFTIRYNYSGSGILFRITPSTWIMTSADINVNRSNNSVSYTFKLYKKDPEEFLKIKDEMYQRAFANLNNTNLVAISWMLGLPKLVDSLFHWQKNKFIQENDFFAAINVKVNKDTTSVFTAPTITKQKIPQPIVDNHKEFASEPTMSVLMYDDILKVIYDFGKSMEKKPSTYKNKDEEGIRDQFLLILETRYDGTTATGETFNSGGKADILLKYANDGSNLFVAECKFWHGAVEFHSAITQLFDRYLTWRDSKTALMFFVTNKDFTKVLDIIKIEATKHPYFVKLIGERGETSFTYHFHLPQDKDKIVYFEIIAFHYDK